MSRAIRLELKVGKGPEENQADTREIFSGLVDTTVGSAPTDDKWLHRMPGQRQDDLYFALHVSQGHVEDILKEIYDYNQSVKFSETDAACSSKPISPVAFVTGLRRRYINRMPTTAEGKVIYGVLLGNGRLQFRCSKDVTHRQRMES
jgi:hypothetical protein